MQTFWIFGFFDTESGGATSDRKGRNFKDGYLDEIVAYEDEKGSKKRITFRYVQWYQVYLHMSKFE